MDDDERRAARDDLLGIYLNDHRAGAAFGVSLARRSARSNAGTPLGDFLEHLSAEIGEDRDALEKVMADVGVDVDRLKVVAAEAAERLARLKLNGRLLGYSDLSRLVELEGLCAGVGAKGSMWRALRLLADRDDRLSMTELDRLVERASSQRERLEHHRLEAAARALGRGDAEASAS